MRRDQIDGEVVVGIVAFVMNCSKIKMSLRLMRGFAAEENGGLEILGSRILVISKTQS